MSLRTNRFVMGLLILAACLIVGVLAIMKNTDPALVLSVLGPITTFGAGYIGFGNWHDLTVRKAQQQ